jgi:hypothetical protein
MEAKSRKEMGSKSVQSFHYLTSTSQQPQNIILGKGFMGPPENFLLPSN